MLLTGAELFPVIISAVVHQQTEVSSVSVQRAPCPTVESPGSE